MVGVRATKEEKNIKTSRQDTGTDEKIGRSKKTKLFIKMKDKSGITIDGYVWYSMFQMKTIFGKTPETIGQKVVKLLKSIVMD